MDDLERALAVAKENRSNHQRWLAWRMRGNAGDDMAGDAEHHREAIAEYDTIVYVLERCRREHG